MDHRPGRSSGGRRHGLSDAAARSVGPRVFPGASRQSRAGRLHRRGGPRPRHQRSGPAALLRAQPQAGRQGRRVCRRDFDLDLARLFLRLLLAAAAAGDRGVDPSGWRGAGALSRSLERGHARAGGRSLPAGHPAIARTGKFRRRRVAVRWRRANRTSTARFRGTACTWCTASRKPRSRTCGWPICRSI